jgi:hypothetical protein
MSEQQQLVEIWKQIKEAVDVLELDVTKYSRGVAAAGLRARKGMRAVKSMMSEFVRESVKLEKENKLVKEPSSKKKSKGE